MAKPNILITGMNTNYSWWSPKPCTLVSKLYTLYYKCSGTPGVGKSRLCAELSKKHGLRWQDVSAIAKDNGFVEEYDETLDCPVLDEDKVKFVSIN